MHRLEFKLLMKLRPYRRVRGIHRLCSLLEARYNNAAQPVELLLHGRSVVLNPGNIYPFLIQDCPTFNDPLVELVHQTCIAKKRAVSMLDVGAATGDSVLLLMERCPGEVKQFFCVEGDPEFAHLLARNLAGFGNATIIHTLLASHFVDVPALSKHHRGTAACIGDEKARAVPLDSLELLHDAAPDILKVDVDGFDGAVIAGAMKLLSKSQPAVIFEWHPKLILATGNDISSAFPFLGAAGYEKFAWFDNVGLFSHFSECPSLASLRRMADYLVRVNNRSDAHFDVVAIPSSLPIDEVALAAMDHARRAHPSVHS